MTDRTLMAGDDLYPVRGDRRRRRRRQRRGRSAVAVVLALVVVLAVIGGVVYVGSRLVGGFLGMNADYPGAGTTPVRVEIKEGQSTRSIASTLHDADVIRTTGAFVNAARGNARASTIQPGFYKLKKEMKASIALAALLDDKNRVN
ncbi:MAG TPA: endolytic transglycosylase MltG, partial [Actinomycetes bacterium]|nr:endolytic transglycosylase MltG [Actinomycetes bacterium]